MGQLAVRIGLTGGDLRAIVMRGAAEGRGNQALEDAYKALRRERDKLLLEGANLRQALLALVEDHDADARVRRLSTKGSFWRCSTASFRKPRLLRDN